MVHNGQTAPMYVYQLPFDVNKELCRLLDMDGVWKDLAGTPNMGFHSQTITEIEQTARHHNTSPTDDLLTRWGQQNHKVLELCKLLYDIKHLPALQCLEMQVEDRRLLRALEKKNEINQRGKRPTRREKSTVQMVLPEQIDPDLVRQHAPVLQKIPYEDLIKATNNWSADKLLGSGGFGTVYKGQWKETDIAIKRLNSKNSSRNEDLIRELWPNEYRHDNLVPIYGYSLRGQESFLVYQLMTGGSLAQRLYNRTYHPPLTWTQRLRIAHGVAKGLQFLHEKRETPLIHGDIKPANILLDQYTLPKIGDFGFAREGDFDSDNKTHLIVARRQGTEGYVPIEYRTCGILSTALDVFSFGVVLMEVATRQRALRSGLSLRDYILYQSLRGDLAALEDQMIFSKNPNLCRAFITIGLRCTELKRHDRPTMLQVYKELNAMNVPSDPDF